MRTRSWKGVIGQALVILVLAFLLYALVDLLYVCLLPLRSRSELLQPIQQRPVGEPRAYSDSGFWQSRLGEGTQPVTRTVTLTATTTNIDISMDLWISKTHPLIYDLIDWRAEENRLALVQAAFGKISIDGKGFLEQELFPLAWTVDPESPLFHLHAQASRATDGHPSVSVDRSDTVQSVSPDQDEVSLTLAGLRLRYTSLLPDSATHNLVTWRHSTGERIYLWLEPVEVPENAVPASSGLERESRQKFLQRLGDLIDIPLVSRMLYSLVLALPLLIFLQLVSRYPGEKRPFVIGLAGAVGGLLLFHFTLHFLTGSGQLTDDSRWVQRISEWLSQTIEPYFSPRISPLLRSGPDRIAPVILGIIVPAVLMQRLGGESPRARRPAARLVRALAVLVLFGGLVIPTVYVLMSLDWGQLMSFDWREFAFPAVPMWVPVLFFASLLILGIWRLLHLLYQRIALQLPPPGLTLLAAFLVAAMGAISGYTQGTDSLEAWQPWIWLALTATLGVSLEFALVNTLRIPVRQIFGSLTVPRWTKFLAFFFAVGLAVPMTRLVSPTYQLAYYNSVMAFGDYLDDWIIFAWLAGVLYLLYQTGRKSQRIDAFPRMIGILGTSSLLFSVYSRWLYIPITFLIGWLVLERWFVQPAKHWNELRPYFKRVFEERLALLDQIMDLNAIQVAYRQFRKHMSEKLSSGEVDFEGYDEQLEKRRTELDTLRDSAKIKNRPIKELALAFGPYPSAWRNGIHGAKYALLFAVPWLVLYLRDFLTSPMPQQTYPIWAFAMAILTIVARWTTYGFFFGYFYPYLRGENGLQKGFGLFLCTVLPALPLMALYRTTAESWQPGLFWALQVFIHCMLLGLVAFDYSILRQGRYDWQMLFEVHGLTSVGVSVSSILVAIGVAITTLMTSQATNLVTLALKFIIPQFPTDLPIP